MFLFISFFTPGKGKSSIHQATSGRVIASESAATSRSSRYVNRPSVSTSALVAPVSASVEESSVSAGIGQVDGRAESVGSAVSGRPAASVFPRATAADPPPPNGNRREDPNDRVWCPGPPPSSSTRSQPSAIDCTMTSSMILVRAISHQPLRPTRGALAPIARPCSPARRSASGSLNSASGRAVSVARCIAVHRAVSETWLTCPAISRLVE